jgi:hypothetical protein
MVYTIWGLGNESEKYLKIYKKSISKFPFLHYPGVNISVEIFAGHGI